MSAPTLVELRPRPPSPAEAHAFPVALVCMPFASADRPSIQLGLLGSIVSAAGHPCDPWQLNLDLAAVLTPEVYEQLCERRAHMTGEWLFAPAAFGDDAPGEDDDYFDRFGDDFAWGADIGKDLGWFRELRHVVLPAFVDRCATSIDWGAYGAVGFSSMFQQNVASLALARRIKASYPDVALVFGGANMEGEMGAEYARSFPWIDHVVSGEADDALPRLLGQLATGVRQPIPGVVSRSGDDLVQGGDAQPVVDLDRLPVPTYDAYFARSAELGLEPYYRATYTLPYESSRGCWWGQKHHCTFCGLNGQGMAFRSKSPDRVRSELDQLAGRHRVCSFMAVDNILDVRYIGTVFPGLEADRVDYNFFYEVKANLTRAQIATLYRGGVRRVQPGIESLSTHVLQLMRKGCTMLQNVRCMKWLRYYGIGVNWNLIWGFPGETDQDYVDQLAVLQAITHLEPPVGNGRIWLERFSPHFTDPAFEVTAMQAEASYRFVYPAGVDLRRAAYFFDYEMAGTTTPESHESTLAFVNAWRESWESGSRHHLRYRRTADGVLIDRSRGPGDQHTISVTGPAALIYDVALEALLAVYSVEEVRAALEEFCDAGLMLGEDDKYLSLALPLNPNW